MTNNIEFDEGAFGIKATLKGSWDDKYSEFLIEKNVQELELNTGKGWRGENIDFLKHLPRLKSLIIIDFKIKSIEAVQTQSELIKLHLSTYCKKTIDFNAFPNLISCSFEWIKGAESLFKVTTLKRLTINRYGNNNVDDFSNLNNLEKLTISNAPIENIDGLSSLTNLNYLSLSNLNRLSSLQGLQKLIELKELEIQRCKGIFAIPEVFKLEKLERLLLIDLGSIDSIVNILNLKKLKEFFFYESTNILDGNLFPLIELKDLNKISFQNRKHYSHKREDFGKLYS
jgi:hypothetical protein